MDLLGRGHLLLMSSAIRDCYPETVDLIPIHHGFTPRNSGSDRRTWTPIPKFFSPRRFNTFRTRDALSSATAYPLNEASLHQKPASPHNERSRTHPSVSQRCHQHKQTRERVGECRSSLLSTQGASRTREHLFLHPPCHNAQ